MFKKISKKIKVIGTRLVLSDACGRLSIRKDVGIFCENRPSALLALLLGLCIGSLVCTGSVVRAAPIDVGNSEGISDSDGGGTDGGLELEALGEVSVTPGIAENENEKEGLAGPFMPVGTDKAQGVGGDGGRGLDVEGLGGYRPTGGLDAGRPKVVDPEVKEVGPEVEGREEVTQRPQEFFNMTSGERKILHEEFEKELFGAEANATPIMSFLRLALLGAIPLVLLLLLLIWKYRSIGLSRPRWMMSKAEVDRERYGEY